MIIFGIIAIGIDKYNWGTPCPKIIACSPNLGQKYDLHKILKQLLTTNFSNRGIIKEAAPKRHLKL